MLVICSLGSSSSYANDYVIAAGQSQTFNIFATVSGTVSGAISVSTSLTSAGFVWDDASTNGASGVGLTGSLINNFPTNSWTIQSNSGPVGQPSIAITGTDGTQTSASSITAKIGDTFTISGAPQNIEGLQYYLGSSELVGPPPAGYYNRAFFFNQNFATCTNNDASSSVWTLTCTVTAVGTNSIHIEIYANGQTYSSNTVVVISQYPTISHCSQAIHVRLLQQLE